MWVRTKDESRVGLEEETNNKESNDDKNMKSADENNKYQEWKENRHEQIVSTASVCL